jgi:septal ring factor EnvC (AmiA/AmiB activator)
MRAVCISLTILALAGSAWGQAVKPDDYKKLYNDTLLQLKAAQDRKSELASRVAELESQIQAQNTQINDLKREVAAFSDKTFFLRTQFMAWEQFILANAAIKMQWDYFLQNMIPLATPQPPPFMDPDWPLSAKE